MGVSGLSRVLSVDPGEVRIGLAISDPGRTIASPLAVLQHVARGEDARAIIEQAKEHGADRIVVGLPVDDREHQARKSHRLAQAIRERCEFEVILWDESGTSKRAGKRDAMHDARAAAAILQDYLDHQGV